MYGGCALSMEQSEVPPKAAADSRVGRRAFAPRAPLAADGRRGWRPATRAAPSSGTAHSLATAMPGAAVDAGCGSVYGAVGPELRFGAAELGRRRISRPPDASVSRAVGCGSVCGVAAAGTANAVGGALP